MAAAWIRCDQFNAEHEIGTLVTIDDDPKETKTTSEAWALALGEPVIMVAGKIGGVHLDSIKVMG